MVDLNKIDHQKGAYEHTGQFAQQKKEVVPLLEPPSGWHAGIIQL
jgi:hypothetical protein